MGQLSLAVTAAIIREPTSLLALSSIPPWVASTVCSAVPTVHTHAMQAWLAASTTCISTPGCNTHLSTWACCGVFLPSRSTCQQKAACGMPQVWPISLSTGELKKGFQSNQLKGKQSKWIFPPACSHLDPYQPEWHWQDAEPSSSCTHVPCKQKSLLQQPEHHCLRETERCPTPWGFENFLICRGTWWLAWSWHSWWLRHESLVQICLSLVVIQRLDEENPHKYDCWNALHRHEGSLNSCKSWERYFIPLAKFCPDEWTNFPRQ